MDDRVWTLLVLEAILPPAEYQQHFGGVEFTRPVFGDMDCDLSIGESDIVVSLKAAAKLPVRAPCFNLGDTDCDRGYDVRDTLSLLHKSAGISVASASGNTTCNTVGEPVRLHLLTQGPGTATPTPTPPPSAVPTFTSTPTPTPTPTPTTPAPTTPAPTTPTSTPTPTPTASPTPAPSETPGPPTPSPTPDTTGPTITNVTANPDGNNPNWVYDNPHASCPTTTTTLSASVSDPSGLSVVRLFVRYYDGNNPPTAFTNVGRTFNGGTQKYEKVIDYPLNAIPPDQASIQYYWDAFDTQSNVTVYPGIGYSTVPIVDCESVIP